MSDRVRVGSGRGGGEKLHLAISTCPNDTFAFASLLEGRVDTGGFEFEIDLLDIDQLNHGLLEGKFDVAKTSFHAALTMTEEVVVLPVGSALGFGVGPLLLAADPGESPRPSASGGDGQLTLCPGELTTAKLLFDLFYPGTTPVEHVVFSDIMPRLSEGTADFGVCIHEGRFTYEQAGLHRVADLGERWESSTDCPLPLGGLVMRVRHEEATMRRVSEVISRSLAMSLDAPETALPAMRRYAQAMDDSVLMQHVDLYVNDWTADLGEVGRDALQKLSEMAGQSEKSTEQSSRLRVL
ncbi:MAG: 1,4-dihydroxy-6-naphthoate synthase [Rhodopirellula sp. JB044]|uniref:1,4-dihydroxy-6-naphthoate synthase n=1 Tax=Rhodopirellula sp. JB044 TaxID=3342844 RepID=UPI00370BAA8A